MTHPSLHNCVARPGGLCPQKCIIDRSKAVLLLWFLNVICSYIRLSCVFYFCSIFGFVNLVTCVYVHFLFNSVLLCNIQQKTYKRRCSTCLKKGFLFDLLSVLFENLCQFMQICLSLLFSERGVRSDYIKF